MLRPIGFALALILLVMTLITIGSSQMRSYFRHQDYSEAVHEDQSTLESGVTSELDAGKVELFVRTERNELERRIADREELIRFVEAELVELKYDRLAAKETAVDDAELVMTLAFADAPSRIDDYADWFYEWKRSYVLLKEAVVSSVHRTVSSGTETWREAVERDISDYFMRHFTDQVLQPERREPLVTEGVANALRHAHERYLQSIEANALRLQLFLEQHTTYLDREALDEGIKVDLDWDAQRWKAPLYQAEDRPFDGAVGVGLMVGGAAGGRVLAPAVARAIRQSFSRISARAATQVASRATTTAAGAGAGSAVPGLGTAVGAAFGFAVGAALDFFGNEVDEFLHREQFVADNVEAVDAIKQEWSGALEKELFRTIDTWYDDATLLLEELKPEPDAVAESPAGLPTN